MDNTNNDNKDKQKQQNTGNQEKQNKSGEEGILTLLQPNDMSKTVESAMHVIQGRHEKLPDLMHDLGNVILKAARRMTTTQLVLTAGAITIGAVLLARYNSDNDEFVFS
ncbi:hypothetical protein ABID22_002235 [Pontibacter aydingkolensis]|uniref:Uncharacterized protein n=1 Tax=Pontibacter aydingkolensis TaxID=1911536 RepID=A0ABS7CVE9_9BACT|nr:hypothetical protein [Pontibacter aydingkolensis]MBW7467841.1 hypothetical protein [Pontibacter aydingkolensis]